MRKRSNAMRGLDEGRACICPECGSTTVFGRVRLSRGPDVNVADPWAGILHTVTCAQCRAPSRRTWHTAGK